MNTYWASPPAGFPFQRTVWCFGYTAFPAFTETPHKTHISPWRHGKGQLDSTGFAYFSESLQIGFLG